jgi:predicted ABC-type ATPase
MSTLYVLGGANGVGKTTWYQFGIENNAISPELPFINIDMIVLREFGTYTYRRSDRIQRTNMPAVGPCRP